MAEPEKKPLSVAQAKRRLRVAARGLDAGDAVRRHPFPALALAFVGGALSADERVAGGILRNRFLWRWLAAGLMD